MRSIWHKPAANASEVESAVPVEQPEMVEKLERLKEAEFVKDFQSRLMAEDDPFANIDEEPGVKNIFGPIDEENDR